MSTNRRVIELHPLSLQPTKTLQLPGEVVGSSSFWYILLILFLCGAGADVRNGMMQDFYGGCEIIAGL